MEKDGYDSPGSGFSERVEKEILRLESERKKARTYSYIVIPDSGIWRKIGHRTFYKLYGLHYFSKSDDPRTAGIQKAIDIAKSIVFIKDGTYPIAPVAVPGLPNTGVGLLAKSNISLVGETEFGTILAGNGSFSVRFDLISFGYNPAGQTTNVSNWLFKDLTLDGSQMVAGYLSGFRWGNPNATGSNGRFENINVQNLVPNVTPPTDGYAFGMGYMGPTNFQRIVVRNVEAHNVGNVWFSALVDYVDIDGIYGDNMFGNAAGAYIVNIESGSEAIVSHVRGVAPPVASGQPNWTAGVIALFGGAFTEVSDVAALTKSHGIVFVGSFNKKLSNIDIHGPSVSGATNYGIYFANPGTNQSIAQFFFNNCYFDGFNDAIHVDTFGSGSSISNIEFNEVWLIGYSALSSGQRGIVSTSTPITRFTWRGGGILGMGGSNGYAINLANVTGIMYDLQWDGSGVIQVPSTLAIRIKGYNPQGFNITTPAMPTSGTAQSNTFPFPVIVYLYGGTVTQITVNGQVVFSSGTGISLTGQSFTLNPGDTIAITYSSAPTWKWYGL